MLFGHLIRMDESGRRQENSPKSATQNFQSSSHGLMTRCLRQAVLTLAKNTLQSRQACQSVVTRGIRTETQVKETNAQVQSSTHHALLHCYTG